MPIPEPGLKEILVKVEAVGICASDAKVYLGAPKYWGKEGEKCRMVLPQIPGHEFSGKVVKLGPNAQDHHKVSIGDLVTAEQVVTCNDCRFCLKGDYNVCIKRKVFGFKGLHGAMAEYMIFPAHSRVYKIPEGMDPFHAAFVEPLSIAIHGINRAEIQFSDVVVISGCGPIGLGMISAAQRKSPKLIVALGNLSRTIYILSTKLLLDIADLFDWKLDIAKRCGASHVFNPLHCNVKEEINKLTENYGCDVYLEVTGNPLSVKQGLDILANHGRFVCMSIFKGEVSVDWSIIGIIN